MKLILALFICSLPAFAAFSGAVVFEVRGATGADTNGGCFLAGAAGTDRSQQAAAQLVIDNSAVTATTAGAGSNVITFTAGYTATSADVGNCVQFTAGTNITAGFYTISSQTSTTWTVAGLANLTTGGGAGSALVGAMGGALATIGKPAGVYAPGNKIFVKADGTYSQTATPTFALGGNPTISIPPTVLEGYTTTRGDGGRATIQLSTNTGLTALNFTTNGHDVRNFIIDCNSLGTSSGVVSSGATSSFTNLKISNCATRAISNTASGVRIINNELTAGVAACTAALTNSGTAMIAWNWIHDYPCVGLQNTTSNSYTVVAFNTISNISGTTMDAISDTTCNHLIIFNTLFTSTRDGIRCSNNTAIGSGLIVNNVIAGMTAFGITGNSNGAGTPASQFWDGNCFYSNTSGNRTNMDDTTTNKQNGVGAYTNVKDVALSVNPFVASGSNDFRLNNTNPGGAQCRAVAQFATDPTGLALTSLVDMGAYQAPRTYGLAQ